MADSGPRGCRYFIVYKPYGVLSQFTPDQAGQQTLAHLYPFPPDVYPVGRLDQDSEGLLILTNDNILKANLLDPLAKVEKSYLAQVEGTVDPKILMPLSAGMTIRIKGKEIRLRPVRFECPDEVPQLPEREPPIRFRRNVPDSWVRLILTEGKNRQVRRMMAAVGYPVLRLVRESMGPFHLSSMLPGEVRQVEAPPNLRPGGFACR